jgi:acetyl esterase/lipase
MRWVVISMTIGVFVVTCGGSAFSRVVSWAEISSQHVPPADERRSYGDDPLQFGELRLPKNSGKHPVAVVIHGGCWRAENDFQHVRGLSAALTSEGIATWTLEYRRIGNSGGGWPGTFEDVIAGIDFLRTLAQNHPIDLDRVVLIGHSAGGHLALWAAGRHNLPPANKLASAAAVKLHGVVGLAAITDLRSYRIPRGYCNASVDLLLGGSPEEVQERYLQANPVELLPLGIPARLLHGTRDGVVPPEQSENFVKLATSKKEVDVQLALIPEAGHFDLIAPSSPAWTTVKQSVMSLLSSKH